MYSFTTASILLVCFMGLIGLAEMGDDFFDELWKMNKVITNKKQNSNQKEVKVEEVGYEKIENERWTNLTQKIKKETEFGDEKANSEKYAKSEPISADEEEEKMPRECEEEKIVPTYSSEEEMENKSGKFKMQLTEFRNDEPILLESLVIEHGHKIGQFCHNLLICDAKDGEVIRERLRHGIDQQMARAVQIRQLIDTMLIDWEIWPILHNFELAEDPSNAVAYLIDELGQKIGKMHKLLTNCGSYYNTDPFDEALRRLLMVAMDEEESPIKKLGQCWAIVPKLMAKSVQEMLENLMMDLFDPTAPFFGMTFLAEFAKELNVAETVCAGILRSSNLSPMAQFTVNEKFQKLREMAKAMFLEKYKTTIEEQMKNIGTLLKDEMDNIHIEKGTMKRVQLIETLKKVQNLFVITLNELAMVEVLETKKVMEQKLDELGQIMAQLKDNKKHGNGIPNDDDDDEVAITERIVSCLNVEPIEKGIEKEMANFATKNLF
ncbi:hypothetical protein niasHT_010165 [Heterodera trifolii]|uniref:Uncharacterized protein n=1 Tax=Heterodera trifolii TaxID=157864 RepID=A0ABD2LWK7_9BILA